MPFADPAGTLAGSIIVASVTFLAIYTTLYPFVFTYFLNKSESERTTRGMAYWSLFGTFMATTIFLVLAAVVAALATLVGSDGALLIAFLFFLLGLSAGTYSLLREISTSRKFLEPYAIQNVRQQAHDKEFPNALLPKLKPSMSMEEIKRAVDEAEREAAAKADEEVRDYGFSRKRE